MNQTPGAPENIVLIGFMGCGKSTVGRELQHRLGYPLVDMDTEIEKQAGKPITRIFSDDGEERFRDLETALLRELASDPSMHRIVSTGGGVVGRPENRELLRDLGFVVWLKAPPAVILERTSRNRDRPLLHGDNPEQKITTLLDAREPLYRETSHLQIDTSGLDSAELSTGILESARYYFCQRTL